MLAPVFDSLYMFFEAALGRAMSVGQTQTISSNERLLLKLMNGRKPSRPLEGLEGATTVLDCALHSTRVMLALTLRQPAAAML